MGVQKYVKRSMELDADEMMDDLGEKGDKKGRGGKGDGKGKKGDDDNRLRYLDSTFKVIADKDDPTQNDTTFNDSTLTEQDVAVDIGTEDQDGSEVEKEETPSTSAGFLKITSAVLFLFALFF